MRCSIKLFRFPNEFSFTLFVQPCIKEDIHRKNVFFLALSEITKISLKTIMATIIIIIRGWGLGNLGNAGKKTFFSLDVFPNKERVLYLCGVHSVDTWRCAAVTIVGLWLQAFDRGNVVRGEEGCSKYPWTVLQMQAQVHKRSKCENKCCGAVKGSVQLYLEECGWDRIGVMASHVSIVAIA